MAGSVITGAWRARPHRFWKKAFLAFALTLLAGQAQAAVFHPETFTLGNGMQVIVVTNRLAPAVAQMVWYKVGAVDDPAGLSGLAHYLEHMMFKGTQTIPSGVFSQIIAAQGGQENAFTTHDYTAYHETIAADRLAMVMQMEADRMRHLALDPKEATPELAVVLSERQERTDNSPAGLFHEKMAAALYGAHPYGRPVIGWKKDIESITPEDAARYYRAHYAPNNAVLVISGNVEIKDVMRLAAATFGALPRGQIAPRAVLPRLETPAQTRVEMQDKRVTQPSFISITALESDTVSRRRSDAFDVLGEVLSGGEVGVLYRHFVIATQQASGIETSYSDTTLGPKSFSIAATPGPHRDLRALESDVCIFMKRLAQTGVSARDVAAAKQRLLDSAIFARDRLIAPAQILGATAAVGKPLSDIENWPHRIEAVTARDVTEALRALLADPHQVTGFLEPAPAKEGTP